MVEALAGRAVACGIASLYEALERTGALQPRIRPLWEGASVAGPAFTVCGPAADNLPLHRAVAAAPAGAVVVATAGGDTDVAIWGSLLSSICLERGILGLVTDGAVRDVDRIRELRFPVFCAGVTVAGPVKQEPGMIGEPVTVAGVAVSPGDLVVGDGDGVVVVPAGTAGATVRRAEEIEAREAEMIRRAAGGESTIKQLGLDAI
jgi:4-hydroxy-4-methyl-2-oxoglutarate aldolase